MLIIVNAIAQFRKWYYLCTSKQMKYNNVMKQKLAENFMNFMYRFRLTRKIFRKMLKCVIPVTPGEALFIQDQFAFLNYLDSKDDKNNGKV